MKNSYYHFHLNYPKLHDNGNAWTYLREIMVEKLSLKKEVLAEESPKVMFIMFTFLSERMVSCLSRHQQ